MERNFSEHIAGSRVVESCGGEVTLVTEVEHIIDVVDFESEDNVTIGVLEDFSFEERNFSNWNGLINGPIFNTVRGF